MTGGVSQDAQRWQLSDPKTAPQGRSNHFNRDARAHRAPSRHLPLGTQLRHSGVGYLGGWIPMGLGN